MRTKNPGLAEEHAAIVNRAIDYIDENATRDIALHDIAAAVAVSPFYLHRLFKAVVQENIHAYCVRRKLERAVHMLLFRKSATLTTIALECGFSSLAVFSRSFKAGYGVSPTDYAGQHTFIKSKICKMENQLWKSYFYRREYNEGNTVACEYTMRMAIRHLPPGRAVYIRHFGDRRTDRQIADSFARLNALASGRGLWRSDTVLLGIPRFPWYLRQPDNGHFDACLTLRPDPAPPADLSMCRLPGGTYAVIRLAEEEHVNRRLMMTCLSNWLPGSDYEFDWRPTLLISYNNPLTDPDRKAFIDFCLPVRSKSQ
ncbi:AraC family transcriptional regulator [Paenibacillus cymbidii]|uniref:AraC family transcriptional regulator n=1 Tax=Paenibacillus cymbidii TaxID=1639034 RepID=UPI001F26D986|nr:helix-turn-helix domain-containing protein [Paenibacillus cymbidii]